MRKYKITLQNCRLVIGNRDIGQFAKASIDAINRSAANRCLGNKRCRRLDWSLGVWMQGNLIPATPDLFKLAKRHLAWS
jgi:hypothetical protein